MKEIKLGKSQKKVVSSASSEENTKVLRGRGKFIHSNDEIIFDNVPIITPGGDILIKSLSSPVESGNHLLIVGGNGTVESSSSRNLPSFMINLCNTTNTCSSIGGTFTKPPANEFTYIPRRPSPLLRTLRDQINYPDSRAQMVYHGVTDSDLLRILAILEIDNIVEREGGWDVTREWRDALSGEDKERITMARLFYRSSKYAILDECTSAVTLDIEQIFYDHATELGITLLTVSHQPSLWKYHKFILQYNGQGGYSFCPLDAVKRLALQEEKQLLEAKLLEVPQLEARLEELNREREAAQVRINSRSGSLTWGVESRKMGLFICLFFGSLSLFSPLYSLFIVIEYSCRKECHSQYYHATIKLHLMHSKQKFMKASNWLASFKFFLSAVSVA